MVHMMHIAKRSGSFAQTPFGVATVRWDEINDRLDTQTIIDEMDIIRSVVDFTLFAKANKHMSTSEI